MRKLCITLGLIAAGLVPFAASARTDVSIGIGLGFPVYYEYYEPGYIEYRYHPAPRYYYPPRRVYYYDRPHHWHHQHHQHHQHHKHHRGHHRHWDDDDD